MPLQVRIKKLVPEAVVPGYASPGDAGLDLTATSAEFDAAARKLKIGFGLAAEIPPGHVGLLFPRSSVHKTGLTLSNGVGVIDSGYRGEIRAVFYVPEGAKPYAVGDRCRPLRAARRHAVPAGAGRRSGRAFGNGTRRRRLRLHGRVKRIFCR